MKEGGKHVDFTKLTGTERYDPHYTISDQYVLKINVCWLCRMLIIVSSSNPLSCFNSHLPFMKLRFSSCSTSKYREDKYAVRELLFLTAHDIVYKHEVILICCSFYLVRAQLKWGRSKKESLDAELTEYILEPLNFQLGRLFSP